ETLDVLEKWLIGDASIRIRDLLLERQQPCDRVGFAAFTQMVVLLSFLGGQTIAPERRGRIVQALRQIFGNGPYGPTQCGGKHERGRGDGAPEDHLAPATHGRPRSSRDRLREAGGPARRLRVPPRAVDAADWTRVLGGVLGDVNRKPFRVG